MSLEDAAMVLKDKVRDCENYLSPVTQHALDMLDLAYVVEPMEYVGLGRQGLRQVLIAQSLIKTALLLAGDVIERGGSIEHLDPLLAVINDANAVISQAMAGAGMLQ